MNKNIKLAVAGAILATASAANAGIIIPAGDWTLDISGNVNTFATSTRTTGTADIVGGHAGLHAGANAGGEKSASNLTTGLLPNFLSFAGTTRQNDLDVTFLISINPGSSTSQAGRQSAQQENRQAYMTFGDKSWGSVKIGKDLGIFASNAILNDMTLLGVGAGAGALGNAGNTTTLGGIGAGFIYADWKAQLAYTTPNFSGVQATVALTQGWNQQSSLSSASSITDATTTVVAGTSPVSLSTTGRSGSAPALEANVSYTFDAGKIWTSGLVQKVNHNSTTVTLDDDRAQAVDLGATINIANLGLTAYGYKAEGVGTTFQFMDGYTEDGKQRKSDGGYVQATYVLPTKTKIGLAYGISNLDRHSSDPDNLLKEVERMTVGIYHPLTKHVNLVAEYNDSDAKNQVGAERTARTGSLGAILFF